MKTKSWIALACLLSAVQAMGPAAPPERPSGRPAKMEDFKWADPWAQRKIKRFTPTCEAEDTFDAHEFLLDDLSEAPPLGLKPYGSALKKIFKGRPYPGSWNGIDPHGYDRNLLKMEYADVPVKVREWIEDQEIQDGPGKGLFAVYNKPTSDDEEVADTVAFTKPVETALRPLDAKKVVIFAPGAVYDILPLWVAQDSPCPGTQTSLAHPLTLCII